MLVLGIETSCDETGIALYSGKHGLLDHTLYSQVPSHALYGGVVPELASRDHVRKTLPLIKELLARTQCNLAQLDGIAYTAGPGLVGALLVGATLARSLGWALHIPTIGVHHLEAHLLAPMLEANPPALPFVALLVSGGHTLLAAVHQLGNYKILGESVDDAAGEAFDKTAKILGLGYPGGPALAALAQQGDSKRFSFPRPMMDRPGLDFSFSGLKTYALNTLQKSPADRQTHADIARAFEDAVVDTLVGKCQRALETTKLNRLVVAGGVGANKHLRGRLQQLMQKRNGHVYFPRPEFCTDNGAMIAYTGYQRLAAGQQDGLEITAVPRWPLEQLSPII